jgi:hypothetical protein
LIAMRRLLTAFLLSAVLTGCVQRPPPERLAAIRTIGVVSALGDQLQLKTIGFTVFGNDVNTMPIDSWRIDERVVAQAAAVLAPRFEATRAAYRPGAFTPDNVAIGEPKLFSGRRTVAEALRQELGARGLDAYLVVLPDAAQFGLTNQQTSGLGIVETTGPFGLSRRDWLYARYTVGLYDGRTLERLDLAIPREPAAADGQVRAANRRLDEGLTVERVAAMSEAERASLGAMLQELVDASFLDALHRLSLATR